jgi:hypothetical protein
MKDIFENYTYVMPVILTFLLVQRQKHIRGAITVQGRQDLSFASLCIFSSFKLGASLTGIFDSHIVLSRTKQ